MTNLFIHQKVQSNFKWTLVTWKLVSLSPQCIVTNALQMLVLDICQCQLEVEVENLKIVSLVASDQPHSEAPSCPQKILPISHIEWLPTFAFCFL